MAVAIKKLYHMPINCIPITVFNVFMQKLQDSGGLASDVSG